MAGLLHNDKVCFYHPLDDYVEYTLSELWTGAAGFTEGKVGQANSAIASNTPNWFDADVFDSNQRSYPLGIDLLEANKFVHLYSSCYHEPGTAYVMVGTVSGSDISWGSRYSFKAFSLTIHGDVIALDSSTIVVAAGAWNSNVVAKVGSISGTTITFGNEYTVGTYPSDTWSDVRLIKVDSSTFVVTWIDYNSNAHAKVGTVSGTGITFGSSNDFATVLGLAPCMVNNTQFVVIYQKFVGDWDMFGKVGTISGTTISFGDEVAVATDNRYRHRVAKLDTDKFVLAYQEGDPKGAETATDNGIAMIGIVSGTTFTLGSGSQFAIDISNGGAYYNRAIGIAVMDIDKFVLSYPGFPATGGHKDRACIGNVSGTSITFGAETVGTEQPYSLVCCSLDEWTFVRLSDDHITAIDGRGRIGEIEFETELTSSNVNYSSAIGAERITTCFWTKNLTKNSTIAIIRRGYTINLSENMIQFGTGTATWNDAWVASLMSGVNDDDDDGHFLVLDFDHQISGIWQLKTSLDGSGFIDRGVQDSGTQSIVVANTDPLISIDNPNKENQWIDECVLWLDTTLFTEEELQDLYDLAEIYDLSMDQFQATNNNRSIDLFVSGTLILPKFGNTTLCINGLEIQNSNMPLSINGYNLQINDIELFVDGHNYLIAISNLFVKGYGVSIAEFNLYIGGYLEINDDVNLFIYGKESITDDLFLSTHGFEEMPDGISLFINGHLALDDSLNLSIYGKELLEESSLLFIHGFEEIPDGLTLFIAGEEISFGKTFDKLLKTADFNPQIIGYFEALANSVMIEAWDLTDATNIPIILLDDECYQIGNTGRWAWSTANLPEPYAHDGQFLFRMTTNNGHTFEGEFFLKSIEDGKWKHPNSFDEYIL